MPTGAQLDVCHPDSNILYVLLHYEQTSCAGLWWRVEWKHVPTWFTGGCQLLSLCVGLFIRMNETWQELHCYLELSLWWCIVLWHGLYLCEEDGQVASHLALEDFGINRSLCSTQWSPKSKSLHRCARQLVWGVCADMLLCVIATLVSFGCRRFGKSKLVFFVEKQLSPGESCKLACLVFSNYHVTNLRTVSI